ncbi:hypothetical protein ACFXKY_15145 [Streptomyces canus]
MTQSVVLQDGASPSPSTAEQRTERVVPLWEAATAQRLSGGTSSAGVSR